MARFKKEPSKPLETLQDPKFSSGLNAYFKARGDAFGHKAIIDHFPKTSDKIEQLKKAIRDLNNQLETHKDELQQQNEKDPTYVKAVKDFILAKEAMKEAIPHIKEAAYALAEMKQLSLFHFNTEVSGVDDALRVTVEKSSNVYIDGKLVK